jgi:hypothetical protein
MVRIFINCKVGRSLGRSKQQGNMQKGIDMADIFIERPLFGCG